MYITVRTIISNGGEIDTAVKVYYDYETAKTNLMMQKDILLLELLIRYTNGASNIDDFNINKYGSFNFLENLLNKIFHPYKSNLKLISSQMLSNCLIIFFTS